MLGVTLLKGYYSPSLSHKQAQPAVFILSPVKVKYISETCNHFLFLQLKEIYSQLPLTVTTVKGTGRLEESTIATSH